MTITITIILMVVCHNLRDECLEANTDVQTVSVFVFVFVFFCRIIEMNAGKPPLTYKQFQRIIEGMEPPAKPVPTLTLQVAIVDRLSGCV